MMNGIAPIVLLIKRDPNKWQTNRPPSFLHRQFSALGLSDNGGVQDNADDARPENN
jgi:hypothetical protein